MKKEQIISFFAIMLAAYVGFVMYHKQVHPTQFHYRFINNLKMYEASVDEILAHKDAILYEEKNGILEEAAFKNLALEANFVHNKDYATFIDNFEEGTFDATLKLLKRNLTKNSIRVENNRMIVFKLRRYPTKAQSYEDGSRIHHTLHYAPKSQIDSKIVDRKFIDYKRLNDEWLYTISKSYIP